MKSGMESKKSMSDVLGSLVTAGTITQAQADAVTKAMPANMPPKGGKRGPGGEHKDFMSSLVTAGTITQTQADAIQEAMKPGNEARKTLQEVLSSLVTKGTITQAQADAVTKAMPARDGKAAPQVERKSPFDTLVTAGTITQAQADAITSALKTVFDAAHKSR
jgi:polyhydroxyalkanoate synthesis regulator phasin